MSDDLVKQLHMIHELKIGNKAADRIEALTAAVEATLRPWDDTPDEKRNY